MPSPLFHMVSGGAQPVAPYSHAVETDGWVFLTGQIPNHPGDDDRHLPPDIEAQTRRVMDNLVIVLDGIGLGLEHVVAARVFLTRFEEDYERMNETYRSYFPADRLPARTCIGVTAPRARRPGRDRLHRPPAGLNLGPITSTRIPAGPRGGREPLPDGWLHLDGAADDRTGVAWKPDHPFSVPAPARRSRTTSMGQPT